MRGVKVGEARGSSGCLPGPADGSFLGDFVCSVGLGVGQGDDVVVVPSVLLHGRIEDAAGAGAVLGPVYPGNPGLSADDGRVVTPQELLIDLLVPLRPRVK